MSVEKEHKIGTFIDENMEFSVKGALHKKPQDNFMFNKNVFSYVSHTGNGYFLHIDKDDYFTEGIKRGAFGRAIYVKDLETNEVFSVGYEPVSEKYDYYETIIGIDYTTIINETKGVRCEWTLLVPKNDAPVELWSLKISSKAPKKLSIVLYSEMVVFSSYPTYGDYFYCNSVYDEKENTIKQINKALIIKDKINAATAKTNIIPNSYCCSKADFIGAYRGLHNPISLEKEELTNSFGSNEIYCCAFEFEINLKNCEQKRIEQVIVLHNQKDEINNYLNMVYSFNELLAQTKKHNESLFDAYRIETGNMAIDRITNIWSKQMSAFGAVHCRWGIKGFRDIVQHGLGYSYLEPSQVKKTLIKCLKHQFSNGFAVRSFPNIHSDSAMKYNDSSTWLVFTITEYVKETGDFEFLETQIPFLDSGSSTVLERLDLIVNSVFSDRGDNGLIHMRGGDWNDSFTHVGILGKGESVWLTMFLAKALLLVDELYKVVNKANDKYLKMYEELKKSINDNAWDGEYYLRAINDVGEKIGSSKSKAAKIFLNAQSWALISGVCDDEKQEKILRSVEEMLSSDFGYVLNYPPYYELDENIGRLTAIEPGTLENASVYTHGNAFYILGLLQSGNCEKAYELLKKINPQNKIFENLPVVPYVYANCYYGPSYIKCPGKMEHSWITGSVNWITMSIIEFMIGVRRGYEGITIKPNLPSEIKSAKISRKYRGCKYDIIINNSNSDKITLLINEREYNANDVLPIIEGQTVKVEYSY